MYNPDGWVVIKIDSDDPHYRVFGSWSGGYLEGDSWRMNSGIVKVEIKDDFYLFYGHSGSIYRCHMDIYGLSGYGSGILNVYIEKAKGIITVVDFDTNWMEMDWIIK